MTPSPNTLLDPLAIQRAESLGLMARFIVEGYMAGEHKSPFRGFAVEFTQHREYVSGDDVRHIDYKVLGRTDRLYLKQYEQETNYVAHILLDGSKSMQYGSGSSKNPGQLTKLQYGKVMAACLSYVILNQRDAVSLSIFDQATRAFLPRTGNLNSVKNIMEILAGFTPGAAGGWAAGGRASSPTVGQDGRPPDGRSANAQLPGGTNIGAVLHELAGQIRRKGIIIIISDLLDDEDKILHGIQHLRFGGNEVVLFHTLDPAELDFPFKGLVEFEGMESPEIQRTRPAEIRESYLRELGDFIGRIRAGCDSTNTHYVLVNTGLPLHEVLSGYMAFRLRTGRG